jgi:hypothetical protein
MAKKIRVYVSPSKFESEMCNLLFSFVERF